MKQQLRAAAFALIAASMTLLSCGDDVMDQGSERMNLITAAPWVRTAFVSTPAYDWYGDGISDTDVLSIMHACEKDNRDIYHANGLFVTDEGPTKCDPGDPQQVNTTWAFADHQTKLEFGNDPVAYTLLELTASALTFESTFVEAGVTYTQVETYGH